MATKTIPLDKLDADPANVRRSYSADGVASLAASIRASGYELLQNLVVRKGEAGRWMVAAGGRRRAALLLLLEQGEIPANHPVPCVVCDPANVTQVSLAENIMREDMHPADQFEAFQALAQAGTPVPDIAARFGCSEATVSRRLALARVSPALLQAYRDNEMTFEMLSAFTICPDHARQEEVWRTLPAWSRAPSSIRRALAGEAVPATDRRVTLIGGLGAYEAAGGTVVRDLFDKENDGFVSDPVLLERLVAQKLDDVAAQEAAGGWKWVECVAEAPSSLYSMPRVHVVETPLTAEQQAKLDELNAALAPFEEMDELDAEASARADALQAEVDAIEAARMAYAPDDIARSGVLVMIDYHGAVRIERGLLRAEDMPRPGAAAAADTVDDAEATVTHSAALVEDLTAQKTAIIQMELAQNPDIALAALVHRMLLRIIFPGSSEYSALQLSLSVPDLAGAMKQPSDSRALNAFDALRDTIAAELPKGPADLWDWCLDRTRDELVKLLAFCAATSVDAVQKHQEFREGKRRAEHADQIAQALGVNVAKWWQPTATNYFGHLSKSAIEAAVSEARDTAVAAGLVGRKKIDAASYAEDAVKATDWLPAPLRIAPLTPDPDASEA